MFDLDEPATLTGRDHPQTSIDAAQRFLGRSGTCRHRLMHALATMAATDEELQALLRIPANTQRPRRVELVRMGLVQASDQRRLTAAGNRSIVWTATALGRIALTASQNRTT